VLRVRVLACLLVAGFAVACRSPTSPEKSLEAHIRDYVGSGAIDCGRLTRTAADQEMQAALNCALDAKGDAESKIAAMEAAGITVSPSPSELGKTLKELLVAA